MLIPDDYHTLTPATDIKVLACLIETDAEPVFYPVPVVGWVICKYDDGNYDDVQLLICLFDDGFSTNGGSPSTYTMEEARNEYLTFRAYHASTEITGKERDAMVAELLEAKAKAKSQRQAA